MVVHEFRYSSRGALLYRANVSTANTHFLEAINYTRSDTVPVLDSDLNSYRSAMSQGQSRIHGELTEHLASYWRHYLYNLFDILILISRYMHF